MVKLLGDEPVHELVSRPRAFAVRALDNHEPSLAVLVEKSLVACCLAPELLDGEGMSALAALELLVAQALDDSAHVASKARVENCVDIQNIHDLFSCGLRSGSSLGKILLSPGAFMLK